MSSLKSLSSRRTNSCASPPDRSRSQHCYSDREPVGPYKVTIPARRTHHQRYNDLREPEPIPRETDFSSVIRSDVPIVAQHTRLDSRQDANALLTKMAYPAAA